MDIYLVGGAVRDKQLGLEIHERDWVVVGATVDEMLSQGYQPVGKDFPVFLHPQTKEEYALARTERKTGPGYTGFEVIADPGISLEEDLLRRDLTINAMAETPDGRLVDPYGGATDLADGLLKHVSPAFAEDPVRILRIARFAARFAHMGFHVAHSTNTLMRKMVASGEINHLVPERVWAELYKTLNTQTPARFFDVLDGCGALTVLLPQLAPRFQQPDQGTHNHDNRLAVLTAATGISNETTVRFAALACDIHADTDYKWLDEICTQYRIPNKYRELAGMTLKYRSHIHGIGEMSANDLHDLLVNLDAFRRASRLDNFLLVCEADARAAQPGLISYPQAEVVLRALHAAVDVAIDTHGKAGKEIGKAIKQARISAIDTVISSA